MSYLKVKFNWTLRNSSSSSTIDTRPCVLYTDKEHTRKWRSYVPVAALSNTEKEKWRAQWKAKKNKQKGSKKHVKMTTQLRKSRGSRISHQISISKICQQKKRRRSIPRLRQLRVARENQGKRCKQKESETGKGRGHSLGPMNLQQIRKKKHITLTMLLLRK
ncbi:hypothetical protein LSAT2_007494, partial [Lamellibrachia satsuma]